MSIDLYIFNSFNKYAGHFRWLDYLIVFFARYLAFFLVAALFAVAYFLGSPKVLIVSVLAGMFSRFIVNELVYFFYKRKRPSEVISVHQLIKKPNHPSFPSGHTSLLFAISVTLMFFSISIGIAFASLSFLVGLFRIFAGVHWPSDILGGMAAGAVSSLLVYFYLLPWILFSL